ncbi:hypothetical protein Hdeb2414_s0525g00910781 [Helianthus debilis subsp. tardiflorus]
MVLGVIATASPPTFEVILTATFFCSSIFALAQKSRSVSWKMGASAVRMTLYFDDVRISSIE